MWIIRTIINVILLSGQVIDDQYEIVFSCIMCLPPTILYSMLVIFYTSLEIKYFDFESLVDVCSRWPYARDSH